VYINAVAVRRLFKGTADSGTITYKVPPEHWGVPNKPAPRHLEPIIGSQLVRLRVFLKSEIDTILKKEKIFKNALKKGKRINVSLDDFHQGTSQTPEGKIKFWKWRESLNDILYTLYVDYPDFPKNTHKSDLKSGGKFFTDSKQLYKITDSPFCWMTKRMSMQNMGSTPSFVADHDGIDFNCLLSYIFPNLIEASIIRTAIQLEFGWSPDICKEIDPNDFVLSGIPTNDELVYIKSRKFKGQSHNQYMIEARTFLHPSSTLDKYSAYNLIKLYQRRSDRLRNGFWHDQLKKTLGRDPLFIYAVSVKGRGGNNSKYSFVSAQHPLYKASGIIQYKQWNRYLKNNLGFSFDSRRLRPTYLYAKETNQKLPLLLQVTLFGHSTSAITDEFYKNTAEFKTIRNEKLARELDSIEQDIKSGHFKGMLIPLHVNKTIQNRILTVFTNYSCESPLAICTDPMRPDWPGSESFHLKKCRMFSKCILCSRSKVCADNIPFIVDRYIFLEQQYRKLRSDHFIRMYKDEYAAIQEVISAWPYKDDIAEAAERNAIEGFILPPVFSEGFII
jgi:hypothetical protein